MRKVCLLLLLIFIAGCGLEKECVEGLKNFDNKVTGEVVARIENFSYECSAGNQGAGCILELDLSGRKTIGSYEVLSSVFEGGPIKENAEVCETESVCNALLENEVNEMSDCECEIENLGYSCICWPYFITKNFEQYRTNYVSYSEQHLVLEFNQSNIGDYLLSYFEEDMLIPIDLVVCE